MKNLFLCLMLLLAAFIPSFAQKELPKAEGPKTCNRPAQVTAYVALSSSQRALYWQSRFVKILTTHPELTDLQRAFIQELSSFVTEENVTQFKELKPQFDKFSSRALALFTPDLAKELFTIMGPEMKGAVSKNVSKPSACFCSIGSSFNFVCLDMLECGDSHLLCFNTESGCGFLGMYGCDGTCRPA